ncbi:N-acetylmuramoyl-L-alanine amidase [Oceanobacillus locisalsi]|uniref:N-acetylmuramoyl-L-alanine amidase n=1 Tax=Oceanobacillus locisalsi TaxID=546107 RepID=A0ABW3NDY4_9BACI
MIDIKQDIIPVSNSNRPQTSLNPSHITVHETANVSIGADAEMHASYVKGENAQAQQVSWHITVDDSQAIQHLPFNEVGWHAGQEGNHTSIGIEICVNQDGDFSEAQGNAITLIQQLMDDLSISINNIVTHQYWTGKNCPANLLNSWEAFINEIQNNGTPPPAEGQQLRVVAESLWVYDKPDWNARYATVSKGEVFTIVEELTVNGSLMYRLKSGLYITGNTQYVELV